MLMRRPRGWWLLCPGPWSRRCASLLLPGAGGREQWGAGLHAAWLMAARPSGSAGSAGSAGAGHCVPAAGAKGRSVRAQNGSGRPAPSEGPGRELHLIPTSH